MTFNMNVSNIILSCSYVPGGFEGTAFGWGYWVGTPVYGLTPNRLLYTTMPIVNNSHPQCKLSANSPRMCSYSGPVEILTEDHSSTCFVSLLLIYFSKFVENCELFSLCICLCALRVTPEDQWMLNGLHLVVIFNTSKLVSLLVVQLYV